MALPPSATFTVTQFHKQLIEAYCVQGIVLGARKCQSPAEFISQREPVSRGGHSDLSAKSASRPCP